MAKARNNAAEWIGRWLRAKALRDELIERLGGRCGTSGCDAPKSELAFHHRFGRSWDPSRCNAMHRMRLYLRDAEAGLLSLLCRVCNGVDGWARRAYYKKRKRVTRKGRRK